MFVIWQGIDVLQQHSEAEHARVRHYHQSNKENGGVTICGLHDLSERK